MKTDTAGNEIKGLIICAHCHQDTAGNHEWNCPNNPKSWNDQYFYKIVGMTNRKFKLYSQRDGIKLKNI
jgi:hypothetical protein